MCVYLRYIIYIVYADGDRVNERQKKNIVARSPRTQRNTLTQVVDSGI